MSLHVFCAQVVVLKPQRTESRKVVAVLKADGCSDAEDVGILFTHELVLDRNHVMLQVEALIVKGTAGMCLGTGTVMTSQVAEAEPDLSSLGLLQTLGHLVTPFETPRGL